MTAVLAVFGPTASGKTAVAEAIADRIPAELVSADSAQVYRGLPILTNQSSRRTRLVGVWELDHEASVAEYQRLAHAAVDEILCAGRVPVVVGGTGLYLRAAIAELELPPAPEPGARERFQALYDSAGATAAHALLATRDPAAAETVHPNDRRRVVRALELAEAGRSLRPARDALWAPETRHPSLVVGLDLPQAELERRIAARTRAMFEAGVVAEVREVLGQRLAQTTHKIMGLEEIASLPPPEAEEALALRTRRLAAYQRKWMRRIPGLVRIDADRPAAEVADEILTLASARERLPAR